MRVEEVMAPIHEMMLYCWSAWVWIIEKATYEGIEPTSDSLHSVPDRTPDVLRHLECISADLKIVVQEGKDGRERPDARPDYDVAELSDHFCIVR
jgi:hypothetical protein